MLIIHLGSHEFRRSNDRFGKGLVLERRQAQITNFDGAGGSGDENVVTFEIAVDYRRCSRMQKVKAFENLQEI